MAKTQPMTTGGPIYLDYLASTPCLPEVVEAMLPFFTERFHNPQSAHALGEEALAAVEQARAEVARLIGAPSPRDVFFTSGATESNNWALKSALAMPGARGRHIVTSKIEHFSVLHPCRTLERQGAQVTYVPVDGDGLIDPAEVKRALRPDTALVSITHANNEIGTLEPVAEIARVCREAGVPLHIDAANTAGFVPPDVQAMGANLVTLSAHTMYGPKGAGALYCRRGVRLPPLLEGGTQEDGRRAGTENVPAIVGFGKAAAIAMRDLDKRRRHFLPLRDALIQGLRSVPGVRVTGHATHRLLHHASCIVQGVESESVLQALAMDAGIFAASGSACSAKALKHSYVLEAMGIGEEQSSGALVFGLGLDTTQAHIQQLREALPKAVASLRSLSSPS
jgi:cysteine desulfurase